MSRNDQDVWRQMPKKVRDRIAGEMYRDGYDTGRLIYGDGQDKIAYGIDFYTERVRRLGEWSSYERGILDALRSRQE